MKAARKRWNANNPDKVRAQQLRTQMRKYGITPQEYDALLEKQEGKCAICKETCAVYGRLCVDHDHTTGKIRGLLCNHCNTGLGKFKDKVELLDVAIEYLKRNE